MRFKDLIAAACGAAAFFLFPLSVTPSLPTGARADSSGFVFADSTYDSGTALDGELYFDFSGDGTAALSDEAAPQATETPAAELPMLVNADNLVPDGYAPDDLIMMAEYCNKAVVRIKGSQIEGTRVAVDALLVMLNAAIEEGVGNWQVNSGYRSVAYQQQMWDNKVYSYRKEGMTGTQARSATARYMAKPGASEHHTGLAFDMSVPGEDSFSSTKQYRWLAENCWDYGFIIRYTAEKKSITGINAEPWHIRYVGLPHSQIMRDTGQCLEEYLDMVPLQTP